MCVIHRWNVSLQGTFVLQDNKFRWLSRVSIDPSSENETQDPSTPGESKAAQAVSMYLYFPCGIIRGVLSNLGIPCAVSADISSLPTCEFTACFACFRNSYILSLSSIFSKSHIGGKKDRKLFQILLITCHYKLLQFGNYPCHVLTGSFVIRVKA